MFYALERIHSSSDREAPSRAAFGRGIFCPGVFHTVFRSALLGVAVCAAGCGGGEDDEHDDLGTSSATLVLADEHNYRSNSILTLPTLETASAADLDICWADVIDDIQCHDVDPLEELDNVSLLRFRNLEEDEVETLLTATQLTQSDVDGYLEYNTDHDSTCTSLSAMSFFGTAIDIEEEYVESDNYTYMLVFAEGTTPGVGARTMMFVEPTSTSTNTRVDAPSGCGLLEFTADISGADPVSVPMEEPWIVDWRSITQDSTGNDVAFESIDSLLVGFYEGMTVAELEEQILDIELIATSLYELALDGGRSADLAEARERETSRAFPGFETDEEGVWLFALMCGRCQNPAPIVLSVLEPTDGDG